MTSGCLTPDQRLRRVEDRLELQELAARYCHAIDDRDLGALADLYTMDADFDGPAGAAKGREAIRTHVAERLGAYDFSYHYPHSQVVEFSDDDEATGIVQAHVELSIDGEAFRAALRYVDRYRREDGRWRFQRRQLLQMYALPLAEMPAGLATAERVRWPGAPPRSADLPEPLATHQEFIGAIAGTRMTR